MRLFPFRKLFVTCSCFFFFFACFCSFLGMEGKREEIWEGRLREDAMAVKYESIELCCSQTVIYAGKLYMFHWST